MVGLALNSNPLETSVCSALLSAPLISEEAHRGLGLNNGAHINREESSEVERKLWWNGRRGNQKSPAKHL